MRIRSLAPLMFLISSVLSYAESGGRQALFSSPNTTYVIRSEVDLEGDTLQLPIGCTLEFKEHGLISNGVLIGNETKLVANSNHLLFSKDLVIQGEWRVRQIFSNWFSFVEGEDNTTQIRGLFALCSSSVYNEVFISLGTYWIKSFDTINNSPSIILIPSNTHVYNEATFKALPNDRTQSFLFYFRGVSNCSWFGGRIVGDNQSHIGDSGEQGFGIALRGAKNITIKQVSCDECWGDGINLQYGGIYGHNENVYLEEVTCNRNRRQGISIEDGVNVVIKNVSITGTGSIRGHRPMRAIDIEPCYKQARICGITIENSEFSDNNGGGLCCSALKPTDSSIIIRNIVDIGGGLRFNNCRLDSSLCGIKVFGYKCDTGKLNIKRSVNNVYIEDCCFMSALNETSNKDVISNFEMKRVTFKTSELRKWNNYCLSFVCAKMDNVIVDCCRFEIMADSSLLSVFPSGGDWTGVTIKNSTIIDHRSSSLFIPCDIVGSKIEINGVLSFVCCKETASLQFAHNRVNILNPENNTFVFYPSRNQQYDIYDNFICMQGTINENEIVVRHKTNSVSPKVNFYNNIYVSK